VTGAVSALAVTAAASALAVTAAERAVPLMVLTVRALPVMTVAVVPETISASVSKTGLTGA
jgi:hypothetical protein